ncbi:MAG TPA: PepSY-like domain-containing protein [Verrucomicrobiae bacterium]|jgi:uncharacterized membrane protein YkoI|nr:PepSY-like domain-containing protein [Verrucomicrobiae bacterium]
MKRAMWAAVGAACWAAAAWGAPTGNEAKLARLPIKAREAARREIGEGRIEHIVRDKDGDKIIFDIDFTRAGKERSLTVTREGELAEVQVFLEEMPAPAQKTVRATAAGAQLGEIDRSVENGKTEYDVEMTKAGATRNFTVAADGKLISLELPLAEAPEPVRKTIQTELAGAKISAIEFSNDEDDATYDVTYTRAGQERELSVDPDGDVTDEELPLAEIPAPVQAAIKALPGAGAGELTVDKSTDQGKAEYEIELTVQGKKETHRFRADGTAAPPE